MVSSPWFVALVSFAALQLTLATIRLTRRDARRLLRHQGPSSRRPMIVRDENVFHSALLRQGYVPLRRSDRASRYVRNPWGFLGPALLHGGMLIALAGITLIWLTQASGLLILIEGESRAAGTALVSDERGPLVQESALSAGLALDRVEVEHWDNGETRSVRGVYTIETDSGQIQVDLVANEPTTVGGVRYIQDSRVGHVYAMRLTREDRTDEQEFFLAEPESLEQPAYLDIPLQTGEVLRLKSVLLDSASGAANLVARVERSGLVVGEQAVVEGEPAAIGELGVELLDTCRWTILVVDSTPGYGLLFGGFGVISLGAALLYLATPREVTITREPEGDVRADWHAVRFGRLYEREETLLRAAAAGGK
ncbi:MAG: cytochrome c biogenesis protein ResB [Coriobacteriia bacterium]|nr:cytochrome c biogenesis protein ResB [Coriobacteriia bacterium]MBN2839964.1 cytochrome c biogenesis protein ResB [Coriobacteriia bacterium]